MNTVLTKSIAYPMCTCEHIILYGKNRYPELDAIDYPWNMQDAVLTSGREYNKIVYRQQILL